MFRNFKTVPNIIFGRGSFEQIGQIVNKQRKDTITTAVFLVDSVFKGSSLEKRIQNKIKDKDLLLWINTESEPTTNYVDKLTSNIQKHINNVTGNNNFLPSSIIGIGGGSTMDIAKAVSIMLTNKGPSSKYQGWDLVKNPAIYHLAVPTLSGTGAEVSRTSVLIGPKKKLGINSDFAVFDQVILDPEMIEGVPTFQRFYTGMDCYIHCVESLNGIYCNTFSESFAQKAMELCCDVFLKDESDANDKLMIASYFGGMSISYSQVGVCHALSYGLSFVLGIRHGLANCVIFNALDQFYPEEVKKFRTMLATQKIYLPKKITSSISNEQLERIIVTSLDLELLWENALGKKWKTYITGDYLKKLYLTI